MILVSLVGVVIAHFAFDLTGWQTAAVALLAYAFTSDE
jgi:hypothetical protein